MSGITKEGRRPDCGSIRPLVPALVWILIAATASGMARGFPGGNGQVPGPALFPTILACMLGLLAVIQAAVVLRGLRAGQDEGRGVSTAWVRAAVLTVAMVGYALLLPWLGFISASALLVAVSLRVLGYPHGARGAAFGLLAGFVLKGFFGILMNVPLPKGWLG